MTVQELIDELNKVEDKSKEIRYDYLVGIERLDESFHFVDIY